MASSTDIITLENFTSKLPSWGPNLPSHLYALVDMGSNGIRFSISDLSPPKTRLLRCVYRERASISLFDALNTSPSDGPLVFPPDVITHVSRTLARFKSIADDHGVPAEHISVLATEAMRKAENAASMLDAILETSGLSIHILAPEVETLFGAMGARSGFTSVNGLFLDLGGGSVQMTYLNSSVDGYEMAAAQSGKSLPFGAAKLIRILEGGETDARVAAVNTLQGGMRDAFAKLQQEFPSLGDIKESTGIDIYLCGGGFRGYGSILMHTDAIQPYPIPTIGAYTVQGSSFIRTQAMRKVNSEYGDKIFGMSSRRRQQFPAIATVVEALIDAIPQIRTATFCSGGNREGALFMKLPNAIRQESPLPLLHQADDKIETEIIQSILDAVQSSLPVNLDISSIPTVFTLGLGPLFAEGIWARSGEPSNANAAFTLHQAVSTDPSTPSFTHLARAILGLTLCSRWGAGLGPIDKLLYVNLQKLAVRAHPEAIFWAEYLGAVASLIAIICPTKPASPDKLKKLFRISSTLKSGKTKEKLQVVVSLPFAVVNSLDQDIVSLFKNVGKYQNAEGKPNRKVEVAFEEIEF